MSRWQTVSVKHMGGSTDSFTRFTSSGKSPTVENALVGSAGCGFKNDVFWLCHDVGEAYIISFSDTTEAGQIREVFGRHSWQVFERDGSLWTAEVHPGPRYEWDEDILASLPEWVEVGGNW